MPLIEATGTSVARIRPDSVKNSTPPERTWLSMSVSEPSWLFGKIWMSTRPLVSALIAAAISLARDVQRMRDRQVVGVFVGELGGLGAGHMGRTDAAQDRGRGGGLEKRASGKAHGSASSEVCCCSEMQTYTDGRPEGHLRSREVSLIAAGHRRGNIGFRQMGRIQKSEKQPHAQ